VKEYDMSPTYLLVTGAWHGGWAWRPVAERLRAAGHRVLTPTLPGLRDGDDPTSHSLTDVVDSVVRLAEDEDLRDVTLVGHSWGGYVITGAAHRLAGRLGKLVYWSAFVPAAGRSLYDEVPPHYQSLFADLAERSGNNSVALPFEVWQGAFMQDASEEVQRLVHSLLVPQPMQYFTETVEPIDAATLGVPVAYVLGSDDVALPPGEYGWDRFPARLGVEPYLIPASHEGCFTRPDVIAESFLKV
jgi:pimeloyl-ACP methyl ester carboxylesterase